MDLTESILAVIAVMTGLYWWSRFRPDGARVGDAVGKALVAGTPAEQALAPLLRVTDPHQLRAGIRKALWRVDWEERPELAQPIYDRVLAHDPDLLRDIDVQAAWTRAPDETEAALQKTLHRRPADETARLWLAWCLQERGEVLGALDVLERGGVQGRVAVARARVLLDLDRSTDALAVLEPLITTLEAELRGGLGGGTTEEQNLLTEARVLADGIRGHGLSQGQVVLAQARRGGLDGRAGVNHVLVGQAIMEQSERIATDLTLGAIAPDPVAPARPPAQTRPSLRAWTRHGEALMRLGKLPEAEAAFARLPPVAPRWFPGPVGVGQCRRLQEHRVLLVLSRFGPVDRLPEAWRPVLPDLDVFTPLERQVVRASVLPLAAAMPRLAARGVRLRVLPIDARAVDLPELADLKGARASDHRIVDAVRGLATHRLGTAPVDGLLDVVSPGGWVFAHELAHLVFFHLPESLREDVDELLALARAHPHTCGAYQQSNADEFFAVAYADHLRRRYTHTAPEPDKVGVAAGIAALFRELEGADAAALDAWEEPGPDR